MHRHLPGALAPSGQWSDPRLPSTPASSRSLWSCKGFPLFPKPSYRGSVESAGGRSPRGEALGQPPGISERRLAELRQGLAVRRQHPLPVPGLRAASGHTHWLCVFLLLQVRELRLREVRLPTQGHTAREVVRGETMGAQAVLPQDRAPGQTPQSPAL